MALAHDGVYTHGWSAAPRSLEAFLKAQSFIADNTKPLDNSWQPKIPTDSISKQIDEYARSKLPKQTYNHSRRVYTFGNIVLNQHFRDLLPTQDYVDAFLQTYYLACMLHDIGTAEDFLSTTKMSFDFKGALVAMDVLRKAGAVEDQSDAVGEAIIRHQDLGETGQITTLGALLQLTTVFDNVGMFPEIVHKDTIKQVTDMFPREGWSGCFAATIREEIGMKPWCHSTHIDDFANKVDGNELMKPYGN